MSAKAIREATGKDLINRHLPAGTAAVKCNFASVDEGSNWDDLLLKESWLKTQVRLVFCSCLVCLENVIFASFLKFETILSFSLFIRNWLQSLTSSLKDVVSWVSSQSTQTLPEQNNGFLSELAKTSRSERQQENCAILSLNHLYLTKL